MASWEFTIRNKQMKFDSCQTDDVFYTQNAFKMIAFLKIMLNNSYKMIRGLKWDG